MSNYMYTHTCYGTKTHVRLPVVVKEFIHILSGAVNKPKHSHSKTQHPT